MNSLNYPDHDTIEKNLKDALEYLNEVYPRYAAHKIKNVKLDIIAPIEICNITHEVTSENTRFYSDSQCYVASAEQAFLNNIFAAKETYLLQNFPYSSITRCFRPGDANKSPFHVKEFKKAEFFLYKYVEKEKIANYKDILFPDGRFIESLHVLINSMMQFYSDRGLNVILEKVDIENEDRERACTRLLQYDINCCIRNERTKFIELGSFGINYYNEVMWIYGTILAEPRFSLLKQASQNTEKINNVEEKPSYHINKINKGSFGQFSKIEEEFMEMKDALDQNNVIMFLTEASDLLGAIEKYIEKYNVTLDDLITMKDATKRAFINGRRT